MTHPAEIARGHIMDALAACQEDPALSGSMELLAQSLAKAQGKLFPAMKLPADSAGAIDMMGRAMDYLAQALRTIQDVQGGGDAVPRAAAAVARSLKALHPAVQGAREAIRKFSKPPEPAAGLSGNTLSVNVNTALNLNTDHNFFSGFSENIEEGGIFVATFDPKPMQSKVLVNFKLPDGRAISARGVVHFVREYNPDTPELAPGMGVRFTDLLESDKEAIERYLKQRAPMFYDA